MGERALQIGIDDRSLAGAIAAKVGLSGHAAFAVASEGKAAQARSAGAIGGRPGRRAGRAARHAAVRGGCVRRRRRPRGRQIAAGARRLRGHSAAARSVSRASQRRPHHHHRRRSRAASPACCGHTRGASTRRRPSRRSQPPGSAPPVRSPSAKATASPKASSKRGRGSFNEDTRQASRAGECPRTNDPRPHFPARIRAKNQARLLPQCLSDSCPKFFPSKYLQRMSSRAPPAWRCAMSRRALRQARSGRFRAPRSSPRRSRFARAGCCARPRPAARSRPRRSSPWLRAQERRPSSGAADCRRSCRRRSTRRWSPSRSGSPPAPTPRLSSTRSRNRRVSCSS